MGFDFFLRMFHDKRNRNGNRDYLQHNHIVILFIQKS